MAKKVFWKVLQLNGKSTSQIGMIANKDHSSIVVGLNNLQKFPEDYEFAVKLYMELRDSDDLNQTVDCKSYVKIVKNEIKKCINEGKTVKEIAEELGLSEGYIAKAVNQIKAGVYKKIPDYKHGTYKIIYL
jgi:exosome complex RNA-binding protein Rrp4